MPGRPTLEAEQRDIIGKKVKRLRREGKVPAIIYGTLLDEPIPVTLDAKDTYRTYIDYGNISLIDIQVNGDTHTVYIRNLQQHPVTRAAIHAELFAPNLLMRMSASIPVILIGESPNLDGVVTQLRDSVEAEGLPTDLPGAIEVDVSGLVHIDDTVWVHDLTMPEGVDLITDEEEAIVRLMEVRLTKEDEEADALEAALAEGEEGGAEADAEAEDVGDAGEPSEGSE
jgi:large subunit ribosomal protein L25